MRERHGEGHEEEQVESDTRQRLLEAAEKVTLREGVSKMTLDAVCEEAGMSKGGLFYHFSGKDDLISGMVSRLVERFERDIEANLAGEGAGRWVGAYAEAASPLSGDKERELSVTAALMAAMANDPELAEPLRERYAFWQAQMEDDGLDPAFATLMRLAIDGLWLSKLFGLAPPSGEFREEVLAEALRMIGQAADTADRGKKESP